MIHEYARARTAHPVPLEAAYPVPPEAAYPVPPEAARPLPPEAARLVPLAARIGAGWLTLAAEMAGLAGGGWRSSPDPAPARPAPLPRVATRTLGPGTGSVRTARDFTLATLQRWGTAERSQDIAIVVSELLTNALRHAVPASGEPRPIRFGLLQPGSCVLCAVADPSRAAPVLQTRGSFAETGRGLQIICALSDQWGFAPSDPGKVVWAMFGRRLTRHNDRTKHGVTYMAEYVTPYCPSVQYCPGVQFTSNARSYQPCRQWHLPPAAVRPKRYQ
jgi:anti-sigma regulatory factor (Ser/Thr protein kinase)